MVQIIYCPEEYERIILRFKCRGCGWPKVIQDEIYFKATCPICGFPGVFNVDEVKYFRETDYNDGTASIIEINKEDIDYEKL